MYKLFRADDSGNVAIGFALALLPLTLAVGSAVDYSQANSMKAKLQAALDAAVLATAKASTPPESQRIEFGKNYFKAVFNVASPPVPSITIGAGTIIGTATHSVPTTFMGIAGFKTLTVTAHATASTGKESDPCILLLEPVQIGIKLNSRSHLKLKCGVHVNSSSNEALNLNYDSSIEATSVCVKGNYKLNGSTITPTPKINCPVKADPLASLAEPSYGACNFTDMTVQNGQTKTLNPGVYCKKLEIQNNAIVNLNPGNYFFPDAELIVNSGGKLIGSGVMLFFNNSHGFLKANSGSSVQLKAPTSGTYKGIVMFQSRASSSASAHPHEINSDSSTYFEGTIYVPNGRLLLNSLSTLNATASYTALIARSMDLNSKSVFMTNNNYSGTTPLPTGFTMGQAAAVALVK